MYDQYAKTRLYNTLMGNPQANNAIGRTAGLQAGANSGGNKNFFQKRWDSIENAVGTTGAAIASIGKSGIDSIFGLPVGGAEGNGAENIATGELLRNSKNSMNDIAKKYGYKTYQDVWDARDKAEAEGDTATLDLIDKTINPELQAQANANAKKADEKAAAYQDYMDNNYVSKKINQDQGKFAGSAINTLSTAVDVAGLGATPVSNAIQGGIEGVADELEQNGFENFDWGRAGQNAAIGATTGAVTGALNKGISNSLAKRAAAKGLTNTATKAGIGNAIKSGAKTIASGAARGAVSGAVGGATGAGLQSAMNGVEFGQGVQNALQGAVQGAQQGAVAGGIMAGANAAFGKTNFGKQLQNAKTNWDQSGSNFDERLTNTLTSGDSAVGDWLMNKRQSNVLGAAGNLGNSVRDVNGWNRPIDPEKLSEVERAYAYGELTPDELVNAYDNGEIPETAITDMWGASTPEAREAINTALSKSQKWQGEGWGEIRGGRGPAPSRMVEMTAGGDNQPIATKRVWAKDGKEYDTFKYPRNGGVGVAVLDENGDWRDIDWSPDEASLSKRWSATPTTAKGWAKKASQRIVEDINNSNLGNRIVDVNGQRVDTDNMSLDELSSYRDQLRVAAENANTPEASRQYKLQAADISEDISKRLNAVGAEESRQDFAKTLDNYFAGKSNANMPEDIRNMQINRNDMLGYEDDNTTPLTVEEVLAREGINPNSTPRPQATTPAALDAWDRVAQEAGYNNYDEVLQRYAEANPNAEINPRGMAGQVLTWMDQNPNTPTTAAGWAKRAGQRAVEDINNSNLGLKVRDVSQDDPSKQLYNALAGKGQPVAETEVETDTDMGVVPSKTSKEGKLRYARGKVLLGQYGTVDQPMARASQAVKSVQEIADAGFTKPEDVERMANVITGSNGEVSKLTRNLIKNAAPVDTFAGENGQTMEDFIDKRIRLKSLGGRNAGEAVKQTIEANLQSLPSRAEGSVTYTDAPEDVFKVVQNLEASAAELEGRGGSRYSRPTIENIHQAEVLKDTASLLKQRLFDGADVKQALTPEVAQNLKSYDPNNKKYADWVDNTIMKAESINDLRAAQAPFVRMSRYIDNAYTQAATVGGRMAENASDLSRILTTRNGLLKAGIDTVWNSNAARRGRAAVYDKLADRAAEKAANNPTTAKGWAKQAGQRAVEDLGNINLGNRIQDVSGGAINAEIATPADMAAATANYNPSTQLYNAIGRTEGLTNAEQARTANYLADAAQEAEIVPNTNATNVSSYPDASATSLYNTMYGTPTATQPITQASSTNTGYFQPTGDYWTDVIASAMTSAIDADDVTAFATLYGMYQDQLANLQKQASSSQSSSQQKLSATQQRANAAMNSLERLSQMTPDMAYNLSGIPLVGGIATFGGNDYEAEAKSLAQQIGYMVSGSNIKDSEAENIGKSYVPQPWDNEQVRQNKLRRAREIIQQYQSGYIEA